MEILHCDTWQNVFKSIKDNSIDLLLTDPPYNNGQFSGNGIYKTKKHIDEIKSENMDVFDCVEFLNAVKPKMKIFNAYIFCNKEMLVDYITWAEQNKFNWNLVIHAKNNPIPAKNNSLLPDKEYVFQIRDTGAYFDNDLHFDIYRSVKFTNVGNKDTTHPCEKPLKILEEFIMLSSREGGLILDPFSGSGSTLVACKNLKRKYIGIEKEQIYCDMAKLRLANRNLF